ncbi:MAG: hypothetical protein M9894_27220 [Planctomycetes bacterium]|nr:hypothetical protein [Planctomycetota bacterium]
MSRSPPLLAVLAALAACAHREPAPPPAQGPAPGELTAAYHLLRYAAFAEVEDEHGAPARVLVTVLRADAGSVGEVALRGTWGAAIGVVPARRTFPERYALFADAQAAPERRAAMLRLLREHLSRSEHAWYRPAFDPPLLADIGAHGYWTPSSDGAPVEVRSASLPTAVTVRAPGPHARPWIDMRLPASTERLRGIVEPGLEATAGLAAPVVPVIGLSVVDPLSGRRLVARPGTYAFAAHWTPPR